MSAREATGEGAPTPAELDAYLSDLLHRTLGGEPVTGDASAPVVLPDRKDLTVRLVTQHSLERLRDAESDKALLDNMLWVLVGGIIGFFTNVVTGGQQVTDAGYVFLMLFAVALLVVALMRRRLVRRLAEARKRIDIG